MGFVVERPLPITRTTRAIATVIVVALVVGAVVLWRSTRPNYDPDTAAESAAGVTVFYYTEQYDGAIASIGYPPATLVVLPGGCLGVDSPVPALAVFPLDSKVIERADHVAVRVPTFDAEGNRDGSTVLSPGDEVMPGGIVGDPVSLNEFGGELTDHVPRNCRQYSAQDVDLTYSS